MGMKTSNNSYSFQTNLCTNFPQARRSQQFQFLFATTQLRAEFLWRFSESSSQSSLLRPKCHSSSIDESTDPYQRFKTKTKSQQKNLQIPNAKKRSNNITNRMGRNSKMQVRVLLSRTSQPINRVIQRHLEQTSSNNLASFLLTNQFFSAFLKSKFRQRFWMDTRRVFRNKLRAL
jgi:hypothetical protein